MNAPLLDLRDPIKYITFNIITSRHDSKQPLVPMWWPTAVSQHKGPAALFSEEDRNSQNTSTDVWLTLANTYIWWFSILYWDVKF